MSQWGVLYDRCAALLTYIEGLTTAHPFDRTFVADGEVALDFGEDGTDSILVVAFEGIRAQLPGVPRLMEITPATSLVALLAVVAMRDTGYDVGPSGEVPLPGDITTTAQLVHWDRWTLAKGLIQGVQTYSIWGQHVTGQLLEVRPYGPEGNMVGTQVHLAVDLM